MANYSAVKLDRIYFPKHNFPPHFLETIIDIGNIIAASDSPNLTLQLSL